VDAQRGISQWADGAGERRPSVGAGDRDAGLERISAADMMDRLYFVGDGRKLPVTNMFDITGVATEDPKEAFSLVAKLPDGQWLATECWAGDIVASNDA
jgi:hypothetical protein